MKKNYCNFSTKSWGLVLSVFFFVFCYGFICNAKSFDNLEKLANSTIEEALFSSGICLEAEYTDEVIIGYNIINNSQFKNPIGEYNETFVLPPVYDVGHTDSECGLENGELFIASVDASTGSGSVSTWRWHYTIDPTWISDISPWYSLTTKVTNLPAGSYYVEVEDGAGVTIRTTVPEVINDIPSDIVFHTDHADASCGLANGELWISSVDASTGNGSVSAWKWHFTDDPSWQTGVSPWYSLTTKVTNVSGGVYYIEIEDAIGCRKQASEPETVGDIPSDIIFNTDNADATCGLNNGELWISSVDASTGNGSVSAWRWHFTDDPSWQTGVSPWYSLTTKVTNVSGGVYYIEIEDAIGCRKQASEPETIKEIFEDSYPSVNLTQPTCNINTGIITVLSPVGDEYTYSIDGLNYQSLAIFNGLTPGSYPVTYMNSDGCISQPTTAVINEQPVEPECEIQWIYHEFLNPVCGEHEMNAIMVSVTGGTGKYNFDFTFSNEDWFMVGGNTGEITGEGDYNFIFHAEGNEGSVIVLTLSDVEFKDCVTTCEIEIEHCEAVSHCTFTQGFYGNEGGMGCRSNGQYLNASDIMEAVMAEADNPVLFGSANNGWHLYSEDISSGYIFSMLPGGGTPASFIVLEGIPVGSYTNQSSWPKVPLSKAKPSLGSIQNTLFSQIVTFFFNMKSSGDDFKTIPVDKKYIVTAGSVGCGEYLALTGTTIYREIPQPVINFLGNPANGYTPDAHGLFLLANDILAGGIVDIHFESIIKGKKSMKQWLVSPGEISEALDAFNTIFDNCRILVGQFDELPDFIAPVPKEKSNDSFDEIAIVLNETSGLKVYPNPFSHKVTFQFVSAEDANARLEITNVLGQRVAVLMDCPVQQGVLNRVEYEPVNVVSGILIYRLMLNDGIQTGRIIYKKE